MEVKITYWFRQSTKEWVVESDVQIKDVITAIYRFTGDTLIDALTYFSKEFNNTLKEDLNLIN